ncbi:hypothetical protein [Streptomyces sp. NPDC047071]|uniref:hypothetical protein n=1 Tax=Streptomyces sp. NPDC047071 TaxID=3154808 RepID=UPI003453568E
MLFTWRRAVTLNDPAISKHPACGLLGDLTVDADPLRPVATRILLLLLKAGGATRMGLLLPSSTTFDRRMPLLLSSSTQ